MIITGIIINLILILIGYYIGLVKGKKDFERFLKEYPEVSDAYKYVKKREQMDKGDLDEINQIKKGW